jgi:2-polyprenyl-3-methyl-5-hydroxy-6-metoxy-1,4-benzoquinol methylase
VILRVVRGVRRRLLGGPPPGDYRAYLFEELVAYLDGRRPKRVLEIGPKDGQDTQRLLTLDPERLTLLDLPSLETSNRAWLTRLDTSRIEYVSANLMYSAAAALLEPFDVVWCTGVLYHNPEQLRMVRRLADLMTPGGVLVLESATTRRRQLRGANCVEVLYPPSDEAKRKYHVSLNITHLPSARAIESWLMMVGLEHVVRAQCHRRVSRELALARAAYLATRPLAPRPALYYALVGSDGYDLGKAL